MLGAALGDALGLPIEGLRPRRAARMFKGPLQHRLLMGRGMVSDDTDHLVMVAHAGLATTDEEFGIFVHRLIAAMDQAQVPADAQSRLAAVLLPMRTDIVGH